MKRIKDTVFQTLAKEIPNNSRVLDLGCGNGELLQFLIKHNNIMGHGVDINTDALINCVEKGIPVIQLNLDDMPMDFANKSFDFVIFNQTIQQIHNIREMLTEMLRIGKECILGFTNFGFMRTRLQLLFKGKMPITYDLPNKWFDTPNIHFLTIKDFKEYCNENNIIIKKEIYMKRHAKTNDFKQIKFFPNARAEMALYKISREDS